MCQVASEGKQTQLRADWLNWTGSVLQTRGRREKKQETFACCQVMKLHLLCLIIRPIMMLDLCLKGTNHVTSCHTSNRQCEFLITFATPHASIKVFLSSSSNGNNSY